MSIKAIALVIAAFCAAVGAAQPTPEENVERVFHLTYTESVKAQQEVATTARSITDIRFLTQDSANNAWEVRGTAAQVAAIGWLFSELDQPTGQPSQGGYSHEYRMPGSNDVLRVFYLRTTEPAVQFQELATLARSLADARRLYTYSALRAVAVRGTPDQMALLEWLFQQLDKPTDPESLANQDSSPRQYQMTGGDDPIVRVFYLPQSGTVAQFQKIVTDVRTTTQVRRAYTYNAPRAVVFRGTVAQIAQVDRMIQERQK